MDAIEEQIRRWFAGLSADERVGCFGSVPARYRVRMLRLMPVGAQERAIRVLKVDEGVLSNEMRSEQKRVLKAIGRAERSAVTVRWIQDFVNHGKAYRHEGMVLSEFGTRIGDQAGVEETPRYTPGIAVRMEDALDGMSWEEAARTIGEQTSISGTQLQQIHRMRARGFKVRVEHQKTKLGKSRKNQKFQNDR